MHSRKISIRIVFFIVILLSVISITNKENEVYAKNSDFQIKDNVLIKYNGTAENVVIPDGVVSIEQSSFSGNTKVKSITMPNSVTEIRDLTGELHSQYDRGAFADCTSLSSISLSKNLTYIGSSAFSGCSSLKTIDFPDSLSAIGEYAFASCKSLKIVNFPDEITYIHKAAFTNCTSIQNIKFSDQTSIIDEYAFYGCSSLENIAFPSELGMIGAFAFSKCNSLKTINITKNIDRIDNGAFSYCTNIKSFNVDKENIFFNTIDGVLYNISHSVLYAYPQNSTNTKFNIPKETKIIADYAFSGARNLTSITLSNNITNINSFTFANCKKLTSINIPSSMKIISGGAFENCTSLKQIELPEGLLELRIDNYSGIGAFKSCTSLSSITIPSTVKVVYEGVFEGCAKMKSIILKEGVEIFYGSNVSTNLEKISLPKSLIKLDGNQFIGTKWYKNSKAGWVYLGKHLIDFKEDKTHKASKITSYIVKDGTVSINDEAFNNMDKLMKLTVPKSVTYYNYDKDYLGKYDYGKDGSNLENTYWYLNQPNGVVYVGSVAFRLKNKGGSGYSIGLNYGTKEEIEINNKKAELRKKYKLVTFDTISFKKGTVSVANYFAQEAYTNNSKLKYVFPSSLKLIGIEALHNNYSEIQKITWNTKIKYIERGAIHYGNVEEYKLYNNFPSNSKVIGDVFLWAKLNKIDTDYTQIQWMTDEIVSQYLDYDKNSKTLIIKSNIPYMQKIDNSYITGSIFSMRKTIFFENVIIPEEMECIADYLFGYGNCDNPNLKFTKLMTDDTGNEYEQNGVYRKNINTGEWETIALGNYTNDPFEYWGRDDYKLTWDSQVDFWKANIIE
ncbi:MAG: leucine-rich repeat domain-containing protein [Anaerocolumna sp.]